MSRQIVGIDGLHGFVLGPRLIVLVLLIEREPELAMCIAGARELRDHFVQVRNSRVKMALHSIDQRHIVECAGIVRGELQRTFQIRTRVVVALP